MARVTGFTSERMLAIENASVVDGSVVGDDLHLQKKDGTTINAGSVRGPKGTDGINVMAGGIWSSGTSYKMNDTVGFAGQIWTAKFDNTGKVPIYNPDYWRPITGYNTNGWYQLDPNFNASDFNTGWQTFWGTGTAVTTLTSTVGEFETGHQALKVSLGENSSRRLYEHNENLVYAGEVVTAYVRAKVLGGATGSKIEAVLFQSDQAGNPEPFGAGSEQTPAEQVASSLTGEWVTYKFEMLANGTKPRARVNIIVSQGIGTAEVVLDRVIIDRTSPDKIPNQGSMILYVANQTNFEVYGGAMDTPTLRWNGTQAELRGVLRTKTASVASASSGTSANHLFNVPPELMPTEQRVWICQGSGTNRWALHLTTTGEAYATRYGPSDSGINNWLPFNVTWMI